MAVQRLILSIGRIERALSRLEQLPASEAPSSNNDISERHDKLKGETRTAIAEIDRILAGAA